MTATAVAEPRRQGWRLHAVRLQLGLVLMLVILAGVAWVWSARQMRGMDDGPWSSLGGFGWFVSLWVVMMAAMMMAFVSALIAAEKLVRWRRTATWSTAAILLALAVALAVDPRALPGLTIPVDSLHTGMG